MDLTELNPLDWTAEPFLTLYVAILAVMCLAIWGLRSGLKPYASTDAPLALLDAAFLAGGPQRVADTILVGLLHRGEAPTVPAKRGVSSRRPGADIIDRESMLQSVQPRLTRLRADLVDRGLAPSEGVLGRLRSDTWLLFGLPIALGIAKIVVGASRGHPVGILAILVIVTGCIALGLATRPPFRTAAGRAALAADRERHARARRAPVDEEVVLAFALGGPSALAGTPLAPYAPQFGSGNGGSSGSSDGGSCGGDGGGGCGGCSD